MYSYIYIYTYVFDSNNNDNNDNTNDTPPVCILSGCGIHYVISNGDTLRGSSVKIGTMQRRLAWPMPKDDMHKSRSVNYCLISYGF